MRENSIISIVVSFFVLIGCNHSINNDSISAIKTLNDRIRLIENDSVIMDVYQDQSICFYKRKYNLDTIELTEKYWYYSNKQIRAFNFFTNDVLSFSSTYDTLGNIVEAKGSPIIDKYFPSSETVSYVNHAPIGIDWIHIFHTIKLPKIRIKMFLDKKGTLSEMPIEGDTTGYIFNLKSTQITESKIIWRIEDSLTGRLLNKGEFLDKWVGFKE